jgi:hypothetical protein
MDLIGLIMLALLHLYSPQDKNLTSPPGNVPGLSQPSVQSDGGPEVDPNGRT